MVHDGKVTLSTALDNSGFAKGVKKIEGSLGGLKNVAKSLGTAIATAFSVAAVVNFAKESVKAANQLSDALTGLRSILDGQGRSFSDAQKFLEEYTADGLVPMTNAITAYKNLASRGYDDSQIRKVMQALKDASAFGRQASYSMGEAVESATEGLKNENSILVDNAGVTKNVAKMWEEYAASIGTTANNLTQQQKIQAEVNGILEESKYQAGDAAKVAGTLSGQLAQLSVNFNNLKVAVGNALNPILRSLLPGINAAVSAMTRLANAVASVTAALLGSSVNVTAEAAQGIADGYDSAADSAGNLAKSTEAAGKAAKKYLAGFDEITKIGDSSGGSGGGSGGAAAAASPVSAATAITANGEVNDQISPKIQAVVSKIRELIEPLKNIDFAPAVAAFGRLGGAVEGFGTIVLDALEWAWFNILVPLAEWTVEDFAPAALDLLTEAIEALTEILDALKPLGEWLWDNFLEPIAAWAADAVVDAINNLADGLDRFGDWVSENHNAVQNITIALGAFMALWKVTDLIMWIDAAGGIAGLLKNITTALTVNTIAKMANKAEDVAIIALYAADYIKAFASLVAKMAANTAAWIANTAAKAASTAASWAQIAATTAWNAICAVATAVTTAFGVAVAFLTSPIGLVIVAITALIAIVVLLVKNWDTVKAVATNVWNGIKAAWGNASSWFKSKVLDPLSNGFKNMVNGVIGFINGMIRAVVNGVNAIVNAVNKISFAVPDWVPGIGGKNLGFNLETISYPQIPYLAQGAVLPANKPFLAVVGDQKHGTNIEAPLDTIKQALAEVLAMRGEGGTEVDVNITFAGELAALARILKPHIDKENKRVGKNLVKGGATA